MGGNSDELIYYGTYRAAPFSEYLLINAQVPQYINTLGFESSPLPSMLTEN